MCGELENLEHELKLAQIKAALVNNVTDPFLYIKSMSTVLKLIARIEELEYLIEKDK
jgi:hypothetical protein